MTDRIILASGSRYRKELLENAGVAFSVEAADVDERAVEAPLARSGAGPQDVASVLAEAKALEVSTRFPEAYVIGADQTLSLGERIFHKSADMEEARRNLLSLSGRTHHLNSAIAVARAGDTLWRHVEVVDMTMRELAPEFIGRYLARAGDRALSSVGAYQIEGEGIQLFERIEGDYFAIVGLPLLPLLATLRGLGAIDG